MMDDRTLLIITTIVLIIGQHSTVAQRRNRTICGRLIQLEASNETGAAIKLTWNVSEECQSTISYNITYGTIGGLLESTALLNKSQQQITTVLENLIPEREYMIVITVNSPNRILRRRAIFQISGKASPTTAEPRSVNAGGVVGGVVAFVLSVVMVVVIALFSVWLINRRRKQRNKNGLNYISVVQGIGCKSRRRQLHSRPGYLQIIHEAPNVGSHNNNSVIVRPAVILPSNETEYRRREVHARADSSSSSAQVETEAIQTSSVETDCGNCTEKLIKPYAMVDIRDIGTVTSLETASHEVLDQLRAKHQRHKTLPEALKMLFGLFFERGSTSQVKQPPSSGRYHTIPINVNLDISMTVNPSYVYTANIQSSD